MKTRQYYFSFDFYVSGGTLASLDIDGRKRAPRKNEKRRQRGYVCTVEVKAATKRGAAQKIRNRIANMADVANVPEFHYSQVSRGLAVLESDGHNRVRLCKFARPGVEAKPRGEFDHCRDAEELTDAIADASDEAGANRRMEREMYESAMRRRSGKCSSF